MFKYARRMNELRASEIREILKVTEKPEIISFAGGLPAPELFPIDEMKEALIRLLEVDGRKALQYATTEGFVPLREKIAERMNKKFKTSVTSDHILVTSGSQQGLDFSAKLMIDEGDVILCESPSYLGAINAFRAYGCKFVEVPTDEHGMQIDALEEIIKTVQNIKFIYTIPDFQNPTGRTWSMERRKSFMELVNQYEVMVVEDNPYGELRFEGEILPALKALDTRGLVIYLGTFSKTLCPGMRIAWMAAEKEILGKLVLIKQGADLHTSMISQMQVSMFLDNYDLEQHIDKIKMCYRRRKDVIIEAMSEYFPEGFKFNRPEGGLFTWVEMPSPVNAREVLELCLANNVAFVPGGSFFPNGGRENTCRLNYSNMPEDRIMEGIKRMGNVLMKFI